MVSLDEQETVIQFNRVDGYATIYTSDRTIMTKLDKLCASSPDYYKLKKEEKYRSGDLVGKFYTLTDKTRISFRSKKVERVLTEDQKKDMAERMRNIRNNFTDNAEQSAEISQAYLNE